MISLTRASKSQLSISSSPLSKWKCTGLVVLRIEKKTAMSASTNLTSRGHSWNIITTDVGKFSFTLFTKSHQYYSKQIRIMMLQIWGNNTWSYRFFTRHLFLSLQIHVCITKQVIFPWRNISIRNPMIKHTWTFVLNDNVNRQIIVYHHIPKYNQSEFDMGNLQLPYFEGHAPAITIPTFISVAVCTIYIWELIKIDCINHGAIIWTPYPYFRHSVPGLYLT